MESTPAKVSSSHKSSITLTSAEAVAAYIKDSPEKLDLLQDHEYTVTELTGGTANWVFRITDTSSNGSAASSSIIKHAEAFVRGMPSISFAASRMDYEAMILQKLADVLPSNDVVAPARFLAYDRDAKLLRIADGGPQTLKTAYVNAACVDGQPPPQVLDMRVAGAQLGRWLADLHWHTRDLKIGDHQAAKVIYRHSYNNVATSLEENGLDRALGERVNREFGAKLDSDTGSVCHGDFWTGNVLVDSVSLKLTVVDWEMTRVGNGATDVGQFAAEAWLLDRFHGDKGLLPAFLGAYRQAKGPEWDVDFVNRQRIVVQFAVHIAYWPTRVTWADREATREVVKLGADMLGHALDMDFGWFKHGPLAALFFE